MCPVDVRVEQECRGGFLDTLRLFPLGDTPLIPDVLSLAHAWQRPFGRLSRLLPVSLVLGVCLVLPGCSETKTSELREIPPVPGGERGLEQTWTFPAARGAKGTWWSSAPRPPDGAAVGSLPTASLLLWPVMARHGGFRRRSVGWLL
jgi:hypothetical protein